jgi:hypothetical protein
MAVAPFIAPTAMFCKKKSMASWSTAPYPLAWRRWPMLHAFFFSFLAAEIILPPFLDIWRIIFYEKILNIRCMVRLWDFFTQFRSQSLGELRYRDFSIFLYSHINHLPLLMSKSIKIFPFNLCVNIRARKLYTLCQGMKGVCFYKFYDDWHF